MNVFTDILFLFVYLITMLYLEYPDIKNNNYPIHKLYLFIGIFGYYFIVQVIKKIKNKCSIDPYVLLQDSLMISLFCVLGYSLYVDFKYWDYTKDFIPPIDLEDQISLLKGYSMASFIVVLFVTLIQLIKILFKGTVLECDGHETNNFVNIVTF